ncbi:MAG: DUF1499 domain-containing protein [Sneathiella sp.]|nr:DUF1499 domain-containing protein [Sneathiella sp.]
MLRKILKNVRRPLIDFENLQKSRKPNTYLMAPKELCPISPAVESPVFDVNARDLATFFETVAKSMLNTEKLSEVQVEGNRQMDFVQYSKVIGFPDTITVRFMEVSESKSTLAIYSRSHYGYRDFGVNRKRVQAWMRQLQETVAR